MIAGMSTRMFQSHTMTAGMRQQVVARTNPVMSKQVVRLVALLLSISFLVVFSLGQLMHWRIMASARQLDQFQSVRNHAGSEHIALLAKRAQLASRDSIAEQVREKFQLLPSVKDQVHRL